MTQTPKNGGQGNNQAAKTGNSAPIVQPGEDAGLVAQQTSLQNPILDAFLGEAATQPPAPQPAAMDPIATPAAEAITAKEMSVAEMQAFMQQMMQSMATLTNLVLAKNTPVMRRHDQDQFSEVPNQTLDMPTTGKLDDMLRPDKRQEQVDIDVVADMAHAEMLAFLNEMVCVNISDTSEEGAENPVVLGVNGRQVAILRGQDTWLRRCYVELMLRAKPEAIKTRLTRNGEGDVKNHIDKTRSLKYPFQIVQDKNPRGIAWARKIRSEA